MLRGVPCSLFLFYGYGDRRVLHSFPTRRSSDLTGRRPPTHSTSRSWRTRNSLACAVRLRSRSEEHTSELQSRFDLVCRLLLEKKKIKYERQRCEEKSYELPPHRL